EAFLAFALTMLAFATAVSAVVRGWLRALRWRAAGLRSRREVIYDREIAAAPRAAGPGLAPGDRLAFIPDMTFSIASAPGRRAEETRRQRLRELRRAYPNDDAARDANDAADGNDAAADGNVAAVDGSDAGAAANDRAADANDAGVGASQPAGCGGLARVLRRLAAPIHRWRSLR